MKLDYTTLLNPHPIKLSIGTLRKPTLQEIYDEITFLHYDRFLSFLKLTPEVYFKSIEESGQQVTVTHENTKVTTRLFDLILQDENLRGQRQPRKVQTALPQEVFHRPQRVRNARLCALARGSVRGGEDLRAFERGSLFVQDRGKNAAERICRRRGELLQNAHQRRKRRAGIERFTARL